MAGIYINAHKQQRQMINRGLNMILEQYLKKLEDIVNQDSGSTDFCGHRLLADWFENEYRSAGFNVIRLDLPDFEGRGERPYLIASNKEITVDGGVGKDIDILFLGHLDTVFPPGTAAERPFFTDGKVAKGPGVADMKSGDLLAYYIATELAKEFPERTFIIAHNFDEELGSVDSGTILKKLATRSKWAFDMEPGRITGNMVKERKGVDEYEVLFHGIPSHAGNAPEKGASAIAEMAHMIQEVHKLNDPERGITVSVGTCKGGTTSNVIPEEASFRADVRYWKKDDKNEIVHRFMELISEPSIRGVSMEFKEISSLPPMEMTEGTARMIQIIQSEASALGQHIGFESSAGGSDGSLVSEAGTPVLDACGPYGDGLHNEKEYILIGSISERFSLIMNTAMRLLDEG